MYYTDHEFVNSKLKHMVLYPQPTVSEYPQRQSQDKLTYNN